MKTCCSCRRVLEQAEFTTRSAKCRPCQKTYNAEYLRTHRRERTDNQHRKKYGISVEVFEAMRWLQDNVCAICGLGEVRTNRLTGERRELSVDHCHDSGEVRGLLCSRCNMGLGLLGDKPERLAASLQYVGGLN